MGVRDWFSRKNKQLPNRPISADAQARFAHLIATSKNKRLPKHERESAIAELARIGDAPAIKALIDAGHHFNQSWERESAADQALAQLGDAVLEPALEMLQGERPYRAGLVLGRLKSPRSYGPLMEAFKRAPHPTLAWALGECQVSEAVDLLLPWIEPQETPMMMKMDGGGNMFSEAVIALGKIGDRRAADPLIEWIPRMLPRTLQNPNNADATRFLKPIIEAVVLIGDVRAIPAIAEAAKQQRDIAQSAAQAIARLLEKTLATVSVESLQHLATLEDVTQKRSNFESDEWRNWEEKVDCSHIRHLAQRELIRRRFEHPLKEV